MSTETKNTGNPSVHDKDCTNKAVTVHSNPKSELSDAQRAKIERNRQKALLLKQARLTSRLYSNKRRRYYHYCIFTALVHNTTGDYVFARVCLLTGRSGISLAVGGGDSYLPWMGEGVPNLERGYLPWMGEGVPTLGKGQCCQVSGKCPGKTKFSPGQRQVKEF